MLAEYQIYTPDSFEINGQQFSSSQFFGGMRSQSDEYSKYVIVDEEEIRLITEGLSEIDQFVEMNKNDSNEEKASEIQDFVRKIKEEVKSGSMMKSRFKRQMARVYRKLMDTFGKISINAAGNVVGEFIIRLIDASM